MAKHKERHEPVVIVLKGDNYNIDGDLDHRLRAAIYGKDWWCGAPDGFYIRTMDAVWSSLHTLSMCGVPVEDKKGWTRPLLHIMLDMRLMVMNTPARFAFDFMQTVSKEDAAEMLRRLHAADICVAFHPTSMSDVNRIHEKLGGKRRYARHPDTRVSREKEAAS